MRDRLPPAGRQPRRAVLAATCVLAVACRDRAPRRWDPPPVELHGYRALVEEAEGLVRVFDAERRPALVVDGELSAGWTLVLVGDDGSRTVPLPASRPGQARALHEVPAPAWDLSPGVGRVELRDPSGRTSLRWPARWATPPDRLAALAPVVGHRRAGRHAEALSALEAALPGMDAWTWLWAAVERARGTARTAGTAEAVAAWEAAADLARTARVPSEVARRLRAAAYVANRGRDFSRAEALLDRAERIDRRTGNTLGLARAAYYRSRVRWELGDSRAAERQLDAARTAAARLGRVADSALYGEMLGVLLAEHGRYARARRLLERARGFYDGPAADPEERQRFRLNHAWVLLRGMAAGAWPPDYDRTRGMLETVLADAVARGHRRRATNVLANLAWNALLAGDLERARARLDEARARDADAEGFERLFAALLDARLKATEGRHQAARAAFTALEAQARREAGGGDSEYGWRARHGLGRLARAEGRPEEALRHLRAALDELERLGRRTPLRTGRAPFFEDRRALLDDVLTLLLGLGRVSEALACADAAQARVLRALDAELRVSRLSAGACEEWGRRVRRYREADQAWREELRLDGIVAGPELPRWEARTERRRAEREAAFSAVLEHLDAAAPAPAATALDGAGVAAALADDEALLELARLGDAWVGFLVRRDGVTHARPGDDLLASFAARLEGVGHLYVVAGGRAEAFELAGEGVRTVSFLPYAGFLARSAPRLPREAVVVADPAGDLPHARKEGAAVDKALAGFGVRRLTGSEATRVAVLGALDGAPVFHFAGHGVLRPAQPWDAHLRLAGGEALSLADVLSARPALGVVVLSGCDTAAVSVSGRDDLVGLPEALLASGARSVVATVREVPDEAARRFVARFYAADGARRPAHALRAAAKAAGGTAGSVHASFRLFGRR